MLRLLPGKAHWVRVNVQLDDGERVGVLIGHFLEDRLNHAQGPLHVAQKCTRTGMSLIRTSVLKVASVNAFVVMSCLFWR